MIKTNTEIEVSGNNNDSLVYATEQYANDHILITHNGIL